MADDEVERRIEINPNIMVGKPVIRGTRIPVDLIVRLLGQGIAEAELLREYPQLRADDIRAALLYAARVVAGEEILPLSTPA